MSVEACVSAVKTWFGGAGYAHACARCARSFSPVRLDHMSHVVSPVGFNQMSPITACNRFYESGVSGVTSQDFNTFIPPSSRLLLLATGLFL